jgi:hypothetical protein
VYLGECCIAQVQGRHHRRWQVVPDPLLEECQITQSTACVSAECANVEITAPDLRQCSGNGSDHPRQATRVFEIFKTAVLQCQTNRCIQIGCFGGPDEPASQPRGQRGQRIKLETHLALQGRPHARHAVGQRPFENDRPQA